MTAPFDHRNDSLTHEREVHPLSDKSRASPAEVRALFGHEFARLKMGGKVGSYLGVLTASNVRGMQRRKARLAANPQQASAQLDRDVALTPRESTTTFDCPQWLVKNPGLRSRRNGGSEKRGPPPHLHRWEDDGGTVRPREARIGA